MFEKSKFKKKYPLLEPFVKDKELMIKLLKDTSFNNFYAQKSNFFVNFMDKLKLIYSEEVSLNILLGHLKTFNPEALKDEYDNLSYFIRCCKEYDNDSLDAINNMDWQEIRRVPFYSIEEIVIELVFKKYYIEPVVIKGRDILLLFKTQPMGIKKRLLAMARNNNLDFFEFVVEELGKYRVDINDLEEMLKMEINDKLYHPTTREKMGDKNFTRLIVFYFNSASYQDKRVINELLDVNNYELIIDILHFKAEYKFCRYIKEGEYNKGLFELSSMQSYDRLNIICNYISPKIRLDVKYLANLKHSISNTVAYEAFYNKHSESLDLLSSLDYDEFKKLSIEEQKRLYTYIKSLDDNKRTLLVNEIQEINKDMRELYQLEYASKFNSATSIVDKSEFREVEDSQGKKHSIKVYELKDEEPFSFLITVMHHKARLNEMNLYGRPAHKLTIDNPENFCKDLNGGAEIISASLIDQRFIDTFVGPFADVMYIFSEINHDDILGVIYYDGAYPPKIDEERDLFSRSEPMGPEEMMRKTIANRSYNEVAIRRKRKDGTRVMPTAILCYDEINDISLKHAEYFNIPIVVINTNTYRYLAGYTEERKESGYGK